MKMNVTEIAMGVSPTLTLPRREREQTRKAILNFLRRIMRKAIATIGLLVVALPLTACVPPPSTSIKEPLTARPAPVPLAPNNEGAIYLAGVNDHPMFEDMRPRHVGEGCPR